MRWWAGAYTPFFTFKLLCSLRCDFHRESFALFGVRMYSKRTGISTFGGRKHEGGRDAAMALVVAHAVLLQSASCWRDWMP